MDTGQVVATLGAFAVLAALSGGSRTRRRRRSRGLTRGWGRHWVYVWFTNPVGFLLTLRFVAYVGETNNPTRRTAQHRRGAWWVWLTWGFPVRLPLPSKGAAMRLEEGLVRSSSTVGNREYNRGGMSPAVVGFRFIVLVVVVGGTWAWVAT